MAEDPPDANALFEQFGDLFGELFGTEGRQSRAADLRLPLTLTLLEASEGTIREITLQRGHGCDACKGVGAQPSGIEKCRACAGTGQINSARGEFNLATQCGACAGRGGVIKSPCSSCEGSGMHLREESLKVTVPPGVQAGQTLRLTGKGNVAHDGAAGHLYLPIEVSAESGCAREEADLFVIVMIERELAQGGGTVEAHVPGDSVRVEVPAGTKTGAELRMAGYGAVRFGSPITPRPKGDAIPYRSVDASDHRGDLIACLVINGDRVPKKAAARLRAASTGGSDRPPLPDAHLPPPQALSPRFIIGSLLLVALVIAIAVLRRI